MRKITVISITLLCLLMILPLSLYARSFDVAETDMTIRIDESYWYVFTRDNIENNPELEELGLSYEDIKSILYDNKGYMDAILYFEDGNYLELFIRKGATDEGIANLSNYDDEDVLEFAEETAKKKGIEDYSVYENNYKFAKFNFYSSEGDVYVSQYITVVNRDVYSVEFQCTSPFNNDHIGEIETIMESIRFDVDTSLKEEMNDGGSVWTSVLKGAAVGALSGGVGGAIASAVRKKKKSKARSTDTSGDPDIPFNNNDKAE